MLLYFINKQKMFGASDTVQCTKMLVGTCCSCDFFLAATQSFFCLFFSLPSSSEGDCATDSSMIICLINDTAIYFC